MDTINPINTEILPSGWLEKCVPIYSTLDKNAMKAQQTWRKAFTRTLYILGFCAFAGSFDGMIGYFGDTMDIIIRDLAIILTIAGLSLEFIFVMFPTNTNFTWTSARSQAEQIRSEIWYFLLNINPKNKALNYSTHEWATYLETISNNQSDKFMIPSLLLHIKTQIATFTLHEKIALYSAHRIGNQLHYFNRKVSQLSKKLSNYRLYKLMLLSFSLLYALMMIIAPHYADQNKIFQIFVDLNLTGCFIGWLALFATFVQAEKTEEMLYQYKKMANFLTDAMEKSQEIENDSFFYQFIQDVETVFRSQNNQWSIARMQVNSSAGA